MASVARCQNMLMQCGTNMLPATAPDWYTFDGFMSQSKEVSDTPELSDPLEELFSVYLLNKVSRSCLRPLYSNR